MCLCSPLLIFATAAHSCWLPDIAKHCTENVCTDLCRDLLPPFLTKYPANKSSPIQLPFHSSIFNKILILHHSLLPPLPIPLFLPPPPTRSHPAITPLTGFHSPRIFPIQLSFPTNIPPIIYSPWGRVCTQTHHRHYSCRPIHPINTHHQSCPARHPNLAP